MADYQQVQSVRRLMGRISFRGDLLNELTELCASEGITLGRVEAIGAVSRAQIGFYNQQTRKYQNLVLEKEMEITSFSGNISLKDGKPFVHAHILLSDDTGATVGGHLMEGTQVFACEFIVEEFSGRTFERGFDEDTGLSLWIK